MLQINPQIEKYIMEHTTGEDPVLAELNRRTHLDTVYPQMMAGLTQGRFLEFISRMISPVNILEIGTFTGYSGICLAKGLKHNGRLYTIEINDELISFAAEFFKKAGLTERITQLTGDARKIIPSLNVMFDLVYIDAEKSHYCEYFNLVIEKVRSGGWMIADNVLWGEKIFDKTARTDPSTRGILEFNELVHHDERVENLIL
ncbi:MAG: O-methyltransferase, partial [Calditrichaeota bacterium]